MKSKNIVLIGFMGSGKTAVAKQLSFLSNLALLDTDIIIEKRFHTTVADLFETKGEPFFREQETQVITDLQQSHSYIISTGGGVVLDPKNHALLHDLGMVFWLKVSAESVVDRIKHHTNRPLLNNTANREETIRNLLSDRLPLYEQSAQFEIMTDQRTVQEIAGEIWQIYKSSQLR